MAVAAAVMAAAALPAASSGSAGVTVTARVGTEVGVVLGSDGSVRDVSTVPARIVRERRGDVVIVTVV